MIFMLLGAVLGGWLCGRKWGALVGAVGGVIPALVVGLFLPTTYVTEGEFRLRHATRQMVFTSYESGMGCSFYYDDVSGRLRNGKFILGSDIVKFHDGADWIKVRKRQHLRCSLLWLVGMRISAPQYEYMVPRSAERWVVLGDEHKQKEQSR